jgi:hypothetical protein
MMESEKDHWSIDTPSVIPAKAGIQSGKSSAIFVLWVPAFAGMTEGGIVLCIADPEFPLPFFNG